MSSQIARKVVAAFQNKPSTSGDTESLDDFTNREKEILEQLSKGLMYKEIAAAAYSSALKQYESMCTIFTKNCMSPTGLKPSTNFLDVNESW